MCLFGNLRIGNTVNPLVLVDSVSLRISFGLIYVMVRNGKCRDSAKCEFGMDWVWFEVVCRLLGAVSGCFG